MVKLLYVYGDETSSQEALSALGGSGYHAVCGATLDEAERLSSESSFRVVIIGPALFRRQKVALVALATESSLSVILVCTDRLDYTIDVDLHIDQAEGESGILRAVAKASTVESYEVTV